MNCQAPKVVVNEGKCNELYLRKGMQLPVNSTQPKKEHNIFLQRL